MKKHLILVVAYLAFTLYNYAGAQSKNAIKINYLSIGALTFNGAYERAILPKTSLQLGGYFTGINVQGTGYSGYGLTPELRLYTGKEGLTGFFVGPFYRYQYFELTENVSGSVNKAKLTMSGGGVVIGGRWESKHVCFDIYGGPVYKQADYKQISGTDDITFHWGGSGVGFRFGSTIGIAF